MKRTTDYAKKEYLESMCDVIMKFQTTGRCDVIYLNLISISYPDHGHRGRLPLSRKNAHGRAGNRTRDLMISSQEP